MGKERGVLNSAQSSPRPKPEGRKKAEIRIAESAAIAAEREPIGSSHTRISGLGLLSAFGLRISRLRPDFRAALGGGRAPCRLHRHRPAGFPVKLALRAPPPPASLWAVHCAYGGIGRRATLRW